MLIAIKDYLYESMDSILKLTMTTGLIFILFVLNYKKET